MPATELHVEQAPERSLMVRLALILIRVCGLFVRLRSAR